MMMMMMMKEQIWESAAHGNYCNIVK